MIPVILSGGSGSRLWPVSRTNLPKQFCDIFGQSLQTMTIARLSKLAPPWIITNENLKNLTLLSMRENSVPQENALFEPLRKNTAPAIALLCKVMGFHGHSDDVVGVFPADHLIQKESEFYKVLTLAQKHAELGKIVTLGIQPSSPVTSYGYIQTRSASLPKDGVHAAHEVVSFREKPDAKTAESFLQQGSFYWNAGIFVFKVSSMARAFEKYQPAMWQIFSSLKNDLSNLSELFGRVENISIDHAIMEMLEPNELICIPCDIGWNDVGSWDAIAETIGYTSDNKVEIQASGNFIHGLPKKTYALVGVEDLIVVDTQDAILISRKGQTQNVKDIVKNLELKKSPLLDHHQFENRPWGRFEVLRDTDAFKSKIILVQPKQQISYQSHKHREEHWVITRGKGEVVLNDEVIAVEPGIYIKIPAGAKHRIRNPNDTPIEFVEVQLGTYFGEDDIVRYQDDYDRK